MIEFLHLDPPRALRPVNELGVSAGEDYFQVSGNRLADDGYAGLKKLL